MSRLASLVLVICACSAGSSPPAAGSAAPAKVAAVAPSVPPAPPRAPKFAVRDDQTKKLLLAAAAIPEKEVLDDNARPEHVDARNAFAVYTNGTDDNRPSAPIVETCAAMASDADVRIRVLAARCIGNGAGRALVAPSPLRAPIVDLLVDAVERETEPRARQAFAEALAKVAHAKALTPEPGLTDAAAARLLALAAKRDGDPQLQTQLFEATFSASYQGDGSHLRPPVEAFALAQVAKDAPNALTSAAFDALHRMADQAKACKTIAPLLRADAKTVASAIGYVANRHCDDLVDRAIDLAVAGGADDVEALAVLDTFEQLRILPAATRARIAAGLAAERPKVKDKSILDHYARMFARKRNVPCADGIPC